MIMMMMMAMMTTAIMMTMMTTTTMMMMMMMMDVMDVMDVMRLTKTKTMTVMRTYPPPPLCSAILNDLPPKIWIDSCASCPLQGSIQEGILDSHGPQYV